MTWGPITSVTLGSLKAQAGKACVTPSGPLHPAWLSPCSTTAPKVAHTRETSGCSASMCAQDLIHKVSNQVCPSPETAGGGCQHPTRGALGSTLPLCPGAGRGPRPAKRRSQRPGKLAAPSHDLFPSPRDSALLGLSVHKSSAGVTEHKTVPGNCVSHSPEGSQALVAGAHRGAAASPGPSPGAGGVRSKDKQLLCALHAAHSPPTPVCSGTGGGWAGAVPEKSGACQRLSCRHHPASLCGVTPHPSGEETELSGTPGAAQDR